MYYEAFISGGSEKPRLDSPPRRWIMAISDIAGLVQNLVDQQYGQTPVTQAAANTSSAAKTGNSAIPEDTFTASTQPNTAQPTTTAPAAATVSQQVSATPAAQAATAAVSGSANTQNQLQTLNASLAALGLSNADIQQIDQIASQTKDYSPSAYTSLALQFEASAQQAAQPSPAHAAAAASTNAGTNQDSTAPKG